MCELDFYDKSPKTIPSGEGASVPTICCNLAALSVASLFYAWRAHAARSLRRERTLRDRVTYMLWVMANRVG